MSQLAAPDDPSSESIYGKVRGDVSRTTVSTSAREQQHDAPSTPVVGHSSPMKKNEVGNSRAPSKLSTSSSSSSCSSSDLGGGGDSSDAEEEDQDDDDDDAFATPDVGVLSVALGFPVEEMGEEGEGEEGRAPPPLAVGVAAVLRPQLSSTPPRARAGGGGTPRAAAAAAAAAAANKTPRTAPGIPLDAEGRPLPQSRFAPSASKAAVASSAPSPAATAARFGGAGDGEGFFTATARPMPRPVRLDPLGPGEPSSDVEVLSDDDDGGDLIEREVRAPPLCRSLFPAALSSPPSPSLLSRFLPFPLARPRLATAAAFIAGCCAAYVLLERTEKREPTAEAAQRGGGGGGGGGGEVSSSAGGDGRGLVLSSNATASSSSSCADFSAAARPPPLACITVFETL